MSVHRLTNALNGASMIVFGGVMLLRLLGLMFSTGPVWLDATCVAVAVFVAPIAFWQAWRE